MQSLFLITARGGSKGLPGKNIKPLNGKPLLEYSIDFARKFTTDEHICLSTDSLEILEVAQNYGLQVPFIRPDQLANDIANSRDVILHALDFYRERKGTSYEVVILLQPTSPFRNEKELSAMKKLFSTSIDLVVSVKKTHYNPYFSLFEEDSDGFLKISKPSHYNRRQDAPHVYVYNGSIYIINVNSLRQKSFNEFNRIRKFVMDEINSVDIDSQFDWWVAEMILEKSLWKAQ